MSALIAVLALLGLLVVPSPVSPLAPTDDAAAAGADPCGAARPEPGGGYYTCVLSEDFSGTTLNRKLWHVMSGPGNGGDCTADSPTTVSVSGGALHLSTVRAGTAGLTCPVASDGTRARYVSGWINTFWRFSQQYGRFEARMRTTAATVPGLHEAFWLWPDIRYSSDANWPASGEVDIVETYSQYPKLAIPFLHYTYNDNGGPYPGLNTAWNCASSRGTWRTYALEWTASRLSFYVDDKLCLTNTAGAATFRKRFIMSLAQFIGVGTNAPVSGTPVPATLDVDYVRVWS